MTAKSLTAQFAGFTALACALFSCAAGAIAASPPPQQLTVSPLIINMTMDPGETQTTGVSLLSESTQPVTVRFEHADMGFQKGTYERTFIEDSANGVIPFSTRGWMRVAQKAYQIPAGGSIVVPLRITAPNNAEPGSHMGGAFFATVTNASLSSSGVKTSLRTGPIVFITIRGKGAGKPKVVKFDAQRLIARGPVDVSLTMDNRGGTHYRLAGTIQLSGPGKNHTLTIPERYVLPDLEREIYSESGGALRLGSRELSPGRYVISARLKVDPAGDTIMIERTVWIIPTWLQWISGIVGAALITALAVAWYRRWKNRSLEQVVDEPV